MKNDIGDAAKEVIDYLKQPKEIKYPMLSALMKYDKKKIRTGIIKPKK